MAIIDAFEKCLFLVFLLVERLELFELLLTQL